MSTDIQKATETALAEVSKKKTTLAMLAEDPVKRAEYDKFLTLINQPPPESWIKEHPFVNVEVDDGKGGKKKTPLKYIPIERVEMLLRQIFQVVNVEIVEWKVIANSVGVQVRLRVQEPVTGQWISVDGVGAVAMQVDKGANATDFTKIKSSAVMMSLPAAKSYAIKDAAELLGKLFGADLNRKDTIGFSGAYTERENDSEQSESNMARIEELLSSPMVFPATKEKIAANMDKLRSDGNLQKRTIAALEKEIAAGEAEINKLQNK